MRAPRRRVAALACVGALALAAVVVPALHAEVHLAEAAADAAAERAHVAPGPVVTVTHGFSEEIPHRHADGTWHVPGAPTPLGGAPHHHHHDGDDRGDHGRDAPEHLSFALAAAAPPILPPPCVQAATRAAAPAPAPLDGARPLEARRSRGPPARG